MGCMVSGGIIGMFIGAVVLAVGYRIFMDWVGNTENQHSEISVNTFKE
jgi:predicted PurR-regulated permease PerM